MTTKPQLPAEDLGITEEQKENLNKVLAFARAHPEVPFNMNYFLSGREAETGAFHNDSIWTTVPLTHPCGTACCLAGMGLQAGIKPLDCETWEEYTLRVYGINISSDEFKLLFHQDHLNDLDAAIRRLEYYLTEGLPDCSSDELPTFEIPA